MRTRILLSIALLSAGLFSAGAQASANPVAGDAGIERGAGYLIVDTSRAAVRHFADGREFYPTGPVKPDTVIIISDAHGNLPSGLTRDQVRQAAARGGNLRAALDAAVSFAAAKSTAGGPETVAAASPWRVWAAGPTWSSVYNDGIGHMGTPGSKMNYAFDVTAGTQQWAAGQGRGFYVGYNGSSFGTWSKFYGLKPAKAGTRGGGTVPWGNVIATKQFQAKSLNSLIASGMWL